MNGAREIAEEHPGYTRAPAQPAATPPAEPEPAVAPTRPAGPVERGKAAREARLARHAAERDARLAAALAAVREFADALAEVSSGNADWPTLVRYVEALAGVGAAVGAAELGIAGLYARMPILGGAR